MNTTTPADGSYAYESPLSRAQVFARFEGGKLTAYLYAGEAQPLTDLAAAQIAQQVSYLDGVAFAPLARPIGKAAACRLHRLMGRAGIPSGEHYTFAARTLGQPVDSLAALYPVEARAVFADLARAYPRAVA